MLQDLIDAHVAGFALAFYVSAGIALLGALVCWVLVRKTGREAGPVFSHRSRWVHVHPGPRRP